MAVLKLARSRGCRLTSTKAARKAKLLRCVAALVAVSQMGSQTVVIDRAGNKKRERMDWDLRCASLTEKQFKQRYRISKSAFAALSIKIYPFLAGFRDAFN